MFLGFKNRVPAGILSGGLYEISLPLANAQTPELAVVARTQDALNSSTQFDCDFVVTRVIRVITIHNHNLTRDARIRVKLGSTAGGNDIFDGAWESAWSMVFDDDLNEFEDDNWWQTPMDDSEYIRHPYMAFVMLPDFKEARHLRVEFDDTTNPDDYVQFGMCFAGSGIEPAVNMSYGLKHGMDDLSSSSKSDNGAKFSFQRRRQRWANFVLEFLSTVEGNTLAELQRSMGTTGDVVYIPALDDYDQTQRYGFLGTMRKMSALEYPNYNAHSLPLEVEERL